MDVGIVYLDDSEISLEAVKDGLEAQGIPVTTHRNPVTIYAALASVKPSLLLLDANMPTLDGKTICSLVKRHLPKLPIALFSSMSAPELQALVAQCGADGYITKTGDYARVARDIKAIIAKKSG
jgi:DNA-binding response OmpR family regulator